MKKIAISAEPVIFSCNRILNSDWAKQFPGASWLPLLKQKLEPDFEVVTADIALSHVNQKFWSPKDIIVIQHAHDSIARDLVAKGSRPLIITCFESPLYIGDFYDNLSKFSSHFKFRILFSGQHKFCDNKTASNIQVTFPSYFSNDLTRTILPWNHRKFMVAVIGNNYVLPEFSLDFLGPVSFYWWVRKKLARLIYGSFHSKKFSVKNVQLQELRLEFISFFMGKGLLDLYGRGWGSLRNLPPKWQKIMQSLLDKNQVKSCDNKLDTISNYRYALCIENANFPGYVTEKIIDCFVAGVIPIYMGAPDIEQYIPQNTFIDLRNYKNLDELLTHLQGMSESEAMNIVANGRSFLEGPSGKNYSYEGFAGFVEKIVRSETSM